MIKHLSEAAQLFPMVNQEDGVMPGEGLTALQTFTYFVATPVGLFLFISVIAWALTGEKKKSSHSSSITSID
jgi:hypothetical protein